MACLPVCDTLAAVRNTRLISSGTCSKTMYAARTNVKSKNVKSNVQASTSKFQKIETLKLTSITHLTYFLYFLFSDISANWNIPVLQRNTRSAGQMSMTNHPQCTAQVNKTQFIFTIHLIGPNKNYRWMC